MDKIELALSAQQILNDPLLNKGSAFTQAERDSLGLNGYLPCHISTIEQQLERRYQNFCEQPNQIAKYVFLSALQNRNETLFYRLIYDHVSEMLPLIYTPTVGDVSIHYSSLYREHRGVYLSYPLRDKMEEMVQKIPKQDVDVIVVTDGERILGLGDLGVGGMAIPVGKLALYTLFGGIHPARTLPVLLDVGTNNEQLLKDPLYLGWQHKRISGKEYDDFVEAFVRAIKKRYPRVLLQWEDFAKPHAKPLLDRYRTQICSFNDDIQGTAAVALSAILSAVQLTKSALKDQRIVLLGGGSAGLGICSEIVRAMQEEGISEKEALQKFHVVDIHGLVHDQLKGIDPNQKRFARAFEEVSKWKSYSLLDTVKNVHPTILIGVSTQTGAFTEDVVKAMAQHTERPVIFPLSNPTANSEAKPADLIAWTEGKAIIATGSPFGPVTYQGKTHPIAQCNNVYIFPGIGLGVIASGASHVSDKMFLKAARVLSVHAPMLKDVTAPLFPAFEALRAISREIGIAVAEVAQEEGQVPRTSKADIEKKIDETMWHPNYSSYFKRASKALS
jgi:malate dehydrogenase (oxaloacetate-decarboxylating)